jgi:hypothetical protein
VLVDKVLAEAGFEKLGIVLDVGILEFVQRG